MNVAALNRQTAPVNLTIEGRWLASHRPYMSSGARRQLAFDLTVGSAILRRLTQTQASALTGVCASSIATVARQARFPDGRPPISDKAIDALLDRYGAERFLAAIDRITAPVTTL